MELRAVSREEALNVVSVALNCRFSGEGLRISVVSECLRSALYQYLAHWTGEDWQPIASIQLTSLVRRKLVPLWSEIIGIGDDVHPGVMSILDSLAELGDMVRLEGGRWLVAPAHAVRIDDRMAILLGGGPIESLSQNSEVEACGRIRLIEQSACESWAELWDVKEWIGSPGEGIEAWSARLLAKITSKFIDAPNDVGEVVAYLRSRWLNVTELPSNEKGILLCRTLIGTGFSYFLGEFSAGQLRKLSTIENSDDARRLRFYLDTKANCPLKVKVNISQGVVKIRLIRRLPKRESKVLLLGWRAPGLEGEHPGVTHHIFPEECLSIVLKVFDELGIIWTKYLE
ncbi:hypothetical protein EC840_107235 [Rahnella sp. JUb53]|nr:hypothetical protein EC840_107235 [Rahnella sp. JUb53]